ncbi:DNA primase [Mycoplasmopsis columbinasalis]|uniref:DNA primase n=1 Tax=Mycoplasmopsis columbinasalis TaxID=114880 RepID=A0A449B9E3_9BACT|nr:DNA primase [Mycoplasmopsis columbinasalis]VEU77801.1 DNA primase [Mycoplasmopsis columbinasalis]
MTKDLIQLVKDANDIEEVISSYLNVIKKGRNYVALCPFHSDSNPSLSISKEKQLFKCFVCNVGGNVISFVAKYTKCSWQQALVTLAQRAGIDVSNYNIGEETKPTYSRNEETKLEQLDRLNNFFKFEFLANSGTRELKTFFNERNLTLELLKEFDIGFAPETAFETFVQKELQGDLRVLQASGVLTEANKLIFRNRVTFAIRDVHGNVVGFSGRTLLPHEKPKYVNSSENSLFQKAKLIYNYHRAITSDSTKLILTEGFMDVIALYRANYKNGIALMGTALTTDHLHLLKNKEILLFLDGDAAGQNATYQSIKFLTKHNIYTLVANNQTDLDPDELLNQFGPKRLQALLEKPISAMEFAYHYLVKKHNLTLNATKQPNFRDYQEFGYDFAELLWHTDHIEKKFWNNRVQEEIDKSFNLEDFFAAFTHQPSKIEADELSDFFENHSEPKTVASQSETPTQTDQPSDQAQQPVPQFIEVEKFIYLLIKHPELHKIYKRAQNYLWSIDDTVNKDYFFREFSYSHPTYEQDPTSEENFVENLSLNEDEELTPAKRKEQVFRRLGEKIQKANEFKLSPNSVQKLELEYFSSAEFREFLTNFYQYGANESASDYHHKIVLFCNQMLRALRAYLIHADKLILADLTFKSNKARQITNNTAEQEQKQNQEYKSGVSLHEKLKDYYDKFLISIDSQQLATIILKEDEHGQDY